MRFCLLVTAIVFVLCLGCAGSAGDTPMLPTTSDAPRAPAIEESSHFICGLWRFAADPESGTLEVTPLRSAALHANVVPFLEPPPGYRLKVSNIFFDGTICDVDVSLTHPFPGLSEYTGFDVCGIMITNGTSTGFHDPDLIMAGTEDTRLLNPDGYARWWNPREFPVTTFKILGYVDGLLGVPDSKANYNCTLNGYKMFGDDIEPVDDIHSLELSNRIVFSCGQTNTRHYVIDFAGGMIFNYAVDANWEPPPGSPPFEPEDFPPEASRPEAWALSITELENTLWYDGPGESGGDLSLTIGVCDHYNAGLNTVWADSPGKFDPVFSDTPIGGGEYYSTYQIDIVDTAPTSNTLEILVGVESEVLGYGNALPEKPVTAYFTYTAAVGGENIILTSPNGGEVWEGESTHDITWTTYGDVDFVDLYYSKDDFVSDNNEIVTNLFNTGSFEWFVPDDPSETVKVLVRESGGGLEDESDDYFTILEAACNFGEDGFELADSWSYIPYCWSHRGIEVTRQDPTQRVIGVSWPSYLNGGAILVFNASNPLGGLVAQYDTGDLIYCNNDQAMWVDAFSESGVDRIAYNNFGSGSPTPGYQLKTIDWNGSAFVNPQTLPKSGSIWNLCFTPEGDIILHNAQSVAPSFYYYDKSNGYSYTFLFQLQQTTCAFGSVGRIREIVYDPVMDAILLFCNNQSASLGGQLFALSLEGALLFEDLEVFDIQSPNQLGFRVGIDIDLDDPKCRVALYGSEDDPGYNSLSWWFARYSGDLEEKITNELSAPYYGPCRGDIQDDGTLWASPHSGFSRFYKFSPPPDW